MWPTAKSAIEGLADRLGYAMLPKWRLTNLELGLHLRDLFEAYEIDCVIDVGANAGQYGRFLRREVGYRGLIVSIEPLPDCFVQLKQAAADDRDWLTRNFALGAAEGIATFNVMAYSALSSFLEPNNERVPGMAPLNQVHHRISVDVRTLESVIADAEAARPVGAIYLKLDTQGFDLEVVKGAGTSLARVRALQTEVSVVPIYQGMTDWRSSIETLSNYEFELSGLWAVNRDPALKAVEFDCVMVRPSSCVRGPTHAPD